MKTVYLTIQSKNLETFNRECNRLYEEGFSPAFSLVVVMGHIDGENCTQYIQQWMKIEINSDKVE